MSLFLKTPISPLSPLSLKPLKLDRRQSIHFYYQFVDVDTQEIAAFCSKGWLMDSPTHRALPCLSLCCSSCLLKLDGQVCPQEHLEHLFPVPSPPEKAQSSDDTQAAMEATTTPGLSVSAGRAASAINKMSNLL